MRTIKKILSYNLTIIEKEALLEARIINGCWGKGSFNFDKVLKDNIKLFPGYNQLKLSALLSDLKEICFEHDLDYRLSRGFIRSNFKMSVKVFKLFRRWVSFKRRFSLALVIFIILSKYWKKFYILK